MYFLIIDRSEGGIKALMKLVVNVSNSKTAFADSNCSNDHYFGIEFGLHATDLQQYEWIVNNQMENQRNSLSNPSLTLTARHFYSRRLPQRPHSNVQLDKVLKVLAQQSDQKQYPRVRTEPREDQAHSQVEAEMDNILKMARVKMENALRRTQHSHWRQLCELLDRFKKSSSLQSLKANEANLLLKLAEIIKTNDKTDEQARTVKVREGRTREGRVSLQAIKLQKENQILKQQLDNLQHTHKRHDTHFRNSTNEQLTSRMVSQQEFNELTREVEYLRQANAIFRDQKRALQEKINQLKTSNDNLSEEVLRFRSNVDGQTERLECWRNIMAMQHQEMLSLRRDMADLKKEFHQLYRKYHGTLKRIAKINATNHHQLAEVTDKSKEIFRQQLESFQRIRGMFFGKGFSALSMGSRDSKEIPVTPYKKFMGEREALSNSEGVKRMGKEHHRYYRPSFFVFLEKYFEYQGVDRQNFEQINLSVGLHFLTTLRAILDSKHNEYLLARSPVRQFSALPSFVIAWLCNYRVDPKTRKQQQINTDLCFQTIGSFYARLMSNHLNGNWEVITFRELLLETLTVDELAFYLRARFRLLRGDCLSGRGAFEEVCCINYVEALVVIQQVVGDFDYRKKLEQYIKRSVQFQRKKQLIDAHFVLRLLLEYYQYHKAKLFSTLAKTFPNFARDRNVSIPFESYLKIYDYNFFETSLAQKVQIFQRAFSLGRGTVNLENIFTVLNEEGYFCFQVDKMFIKHPLYEQPEGSIVCQDRPQEVTNFETFYEGLADGVFANQSSLLGVEGVKIEGNILRPSKNITFQSLFQRMDFMHKLGLMSLKKNFLSKTFKEAQVVACLPFQITYSQSLIKATIQRNGLSEILDDFRKKTAARAIMRFYRKKKGVFIKSYLMSTENLDKGNKIDQIRKEFTNIIDNIKKKYNNNTQQTIHQYEEIQ